MTPAADTRTMATIPDLLLMSSFWSASPPYESVFQGFRAVSRVQGYRGVPPALDPPRVVDRLVLIYKVEIADL